MNLNLPISQREAEQLLNLSTGHRIYSIHFDLPVAEAEPAALCQTDPDLIDAETTYAARVLAELKSFLSSSGVSSEISHGPELGVHGRIDIHCTPRVQERIARDFEAVLDGCSVKADNSMDLTDSLAAYRKQAP